MSATPGVDVARPTGGRSGAFGLGVLSVGLGAGLLGVWWFSALNAYSNMPLLVTMVVASVLLWTVDEGLGILLVLALSFLDMRTQWHNVDVRAFEAFTVIVTPVSLLAGRRSFLDGGRGNLALPVVALSPFVVFALVTTVVSISPAKSAVFDLRLITTLVFVWLGAVGLRRLELERPSAIDGVLAAGVALLLLLGLVQQLVGKQFLQVLADGGWVPFMSAESLSRSNGSFYLGHRGNLRPFSFFATPHVHAIVVGLTALFLLGRASARVPVKVIGCLALVTLLFSDVYGVLVGMVAALGATVMAFAARRSRTASWSVAGAFAILAVLVMSNVKALVDQLVARGFGIRLQLWAVGLSTFEAHPVLGAGPGTSPLNLRDFDASFGYDFDHLHNWFLEVLSETGIIGFALFILFLALLTRAAMRLVRSRSPNASSAVWVASFFLGCNIVDSFAGGGNIALMWFLFLLTLATRVARPTGAPVESIGMST